ncbi:MAG: hypothetical protein JNM62_13645 [Flavobacteriales bacterium]|nr:hypothetical protein [Flavobacteriales bacterium]
MTSAFLPDESGSTKRPDVISVLGLLTFINTGFFSLIYLIGMFGMMAVQQMPMDEFMQLLHDGAGKYMQEEQMFMLDEIAHVMHSSGVALMLVYLLRSLLRLVGAIGIWRGRKSGFYLYAGAQLVGLFAPHIFLPWSLLGVFGPLMTVAVTATYGSQLKRLN